MPARLAHDVAAALHAAIPAVLPHPALVPAVAGVVAAGQAVVAVVPPSGAPVAVVRAPAAVPPVPSPAEVGGQGGQVVAVPGQTIAVPRGPEGDAPLVAVRIGLVILAVPVPPVLEGRPLGGLDGVPPVGQVDARALPVQGGAPSTSLPGEAVGGVVASGHLKTGAGRLVQARAPAPVVLEVGQTPEAQGDAVVGAASLGVEAGPRARAARQAQAIAGP